MRVEIYRNMSNNTTKAKTPPLAGTTVGHLVWHTGNSGDYQRRAQSCTIKREAEKSHKAEKLLTVYANAWA